MVYLPTRLSIQSQTLRTRPCVLALRKHRLLVRLSHRIYSSYYSSSSIICCASPYPLQLSTPAAFKQFRNSTCSNRYSYSISHVLNSPTSTLHSSSSSGVNFPIAIISSIALIIFSNIYSSSFRLFLNQSSGVMPSPHLRCISRSVPLETESPHV